MSRLARAHAYEERAAWMKKYERAKEKLTELPAPSIEDEQHPPSVGLPAPVYWGTAISILVTAASLFFYFAGRPLYWWAMAGMLVVAAVLITVHRQTARTWDDDELRFRYDLECPCGSVRLFREW